MYCTMLCLYLSVDGILRSIHTLRQRLRLHFRNYRSIITKYRRKNGFYTHSLRCARFPEILRNVIECQILWGLCSVAFLLLHCNWLFKLHLSNLLKLINLLNYHFLHVQGCARFAEIWSELTKNWRSGATEFGVWVDNCNVKMWISTEQKLHNFWRSANFERNEHTPGVIKVTLQSKVSSGKKRSNIQANEHIPGMCSICWFVCKILCTLIDFLIVLQ